MPEETDLRISERLAGLEREIDLIKERNRRVELDKAWEQSSWRKVSILGLTYVVAFFFLYAMQAPYTLLSACIPALGYYLSTQSLPLVRRRWEGGGRASRLR